MSDPTPQVVLRLGTHAEKDYIEKLAALLDGIILGANLLEATPGATSSLLLTLCGAKNAGRYYIDPMTYAFGELADRQSGKPWKDLDWLKSEQLLKGKGKQGKTVRDFKRSYRLLADQLGSPFAAAIANSRAISVSDLSADETIRSVATATTQYQLTRVRAEFEKDDEFKSYASNIPSPAAVLAPYFFCEQPHRDDWLSANLRLTAATVNAASATPVHAVVCSDVSALTDKTFMARLARELPATGVTGAWLWFSTLFEDEADVDTLQALRRLVESLAKSKLAVYNMHGGYFSLALSKYGMSGVSHGVGYGEQKDVIPVIGQSVPTVRYYLPALHRRLGVPDIERCFDALGIRTATDFHERVCDCPVCKGIVVEELRDFSLFGESQPSATSGLRRVQTPAAAKRCRFHYLICRVRERDRIGALSVADIQAMWANSANTWGRQRSLLESAQHLGRWSAALAQP